MLYLHLILLSSAIWALFIGSMTTGWLDIFNGFLSYSQTIDTSSIGPMSAMRFLDFFFSQGLGLMLMKGWALILLWWGINHLSVTSGRRFFMLLNFWLSTTNNWCRKLCILICNKDHVSIPTKRCFLIKWFTLKQARTMFSYLFLKFSLNICHQGRVRDHLHLHSVDLTTKIIVLYEKLKKELPLFSSQGMFDLVLFQFLIFLLWYDIKDDTMT